MVKETDITCYIAPICCVIGAIIIGIATSYEYIDYNEYAFKKNTWSNTVDTEVVYENGKHFWGWNKEAIIFPRNYQLVFFEELAVSDQEEKPFRIDVSFLYRLKKDNLVDLYQQFGTAYHDTILSKVQSTIKNTVPQYLLQEYLENRQGITEIMNRNITEELSSIWIDVELNKMQLKFIGLESTTITKFLDAAVQLQSNDQKEFEQEAELIRQNTTKLVKEVNAETTILTREAEANYDKTIEFATAAAKELTSNARGLGIANVVNQLEFNSTSSRGKFIRLISILDNKSTRLVDVDNSLIQI